MRLELSVMIHTHLNGAADVNALASSAGVESRTVEDAPHILVGSTEGMVHAMVARRERWRVSDIVIRSTHLPVAEPVVRRLADT